VLWHNPVEPLSACDDVNRIFWTQVEARAEHQERWISAEEFMNISLSRYHGAGLLHGLSFNHEPAVARPVERRLDQADRHVDVNAVVPEFYPGVVQS
jgi:hypothetical protein